MTRRTVRRRPGFTLIEMLIVISIIILLLTLGALFLPNLDRNKGVPNATTQIEGYVRLSRNQALRDGAPRGIRLIQDPNDPTRVNALQYIEQPEPIAPRGTVTVNNTVLRIAVLITTPPNPPPLPPYPLLSPAMATLVLVDATNKPVSGWNWDDPNDPQIAAGDFLELNASPHVVARIPTPPVPNPGPNPAFPGFQRCSITLDRPIEGTDVNPLLLFDGFRVIRAPRPLVGEPLVQLHRDVYIDLAWCFPCPVFLGLQVPPPNPTPYGNYFTYPQPWSPSGPLDILFNFSGNVANSPTGQIILAVRHVDKQNLTPDGFPPDMLFVVIYTRTGKVSAVNPYAIGGADPYTLARDGRSSGL